MRCRECEAATARGIVRVAAGERVTPGLPKLGASMRVRPHGADGSVTGPAPDRGWAVVRAGRRRIDRAHACASASTPPKKLFSHTGLDAG